MNSEEYSKLVEAGEYPNEPEVVIEHSFVNINGEIKNLLLQKFTSVAIITSKAGSIRANHYHKTDWHYAYVLQGKIDYFWKKIGEKEKTHSETFSKNQMFFTPPLVEHAMFFPVETIFITFAKNRRDHDNHESDLVRVQLIDTIYNQNTKTKEPRIIKN
tara:strand:+ start:1568 stop:2044 length:477 start_codon:yes stop_codon:yes gene_type:complete